MQDCHVPENTKKNQANIEPDAQKDPDQSAPEPAAECQQQWRCQEGEAAAEYKKLADIALWGKNPRKNDPAAKDLANTIKALGFGSACLTWFDAELGKDVFICGNTRAKAMAILAREVKKADTSTWHQNAIELAKGGLIPCRSRNDLTRREATLMALADNRMGEKAEWDTPALAQILSDFSFDEAAVAGWGQDEISKLGLELTGGTVDTSCNAEPQMERADELQAQWQTESGQLWRCGEHVILCGDSANQEDVKRVLSGEKADLVFTDPPYGVSIGKKNVMLNSVQKAGRCLADIKDDDLSPEQLKQKLLPAFVNIKSIVMSDDCTVFVTAPQGGDLSMMMMTMREAQLPVRHVLIWDKGSPTFSMGRLDYDYEHEPILLTWGKRHKRPMLGEHRTSIWRIQRPRSSKEHPTMKPVELVVNALLNNSDSGNVVFDAYSGSGTTLLACQQTGRRARVIEIEPKYVAVCLQRYKDATGDEPQLVA